MAESDYYTTGATVRWTRGLSGIGTELKGKNRTDFMIGFWRGFTDAAIEDQKPVYSKDVEKRVLTISNWQGDLITRDLQFTNESYRLRKYDAVFSRGDDIISVTLECPADEWSLYEPRFKAALASLRLPN